MFAAYILLSHLPVASLVYMFFFYPLSDLEINVAYSFMLLRGKMRKLDRYREDKSEKWISMHLQPLKALGGQDLKNGVYLKW